MLANVERCVLLVFLSSLLQHTVALVYGNVKNAVNLSSDAPVLGAQKDHPKYVYMFMRVGLNSADKPRSPHTKKAECLTRAPTDWPRATNGGLAVGWMPCEDPTTLNRPVVQWIRTNQQFVVAEDGTIQDGSKRCLRRKGCRENGKLQGMVYDFVSCLKVLSTDLVKVSAKKPRGDSEIAVGFLKNAMDLDSCLPNSVCGPYQLSNSCISKMCGPSYQARPGWTKLASQYVGDDAVNGMSDYGAVGGDAAGEVHMKNQLAGIAMAGLGPPPKLSKYGAMKPVCGTFMLDSPTHDSYFYMLTADSPPGTVATIWQPNR
jgi:hypothetical protein